MGKKAHELFSNDRGLGSGITFVFYQSCTVGAEPSNVAIPQPTQERGKNTAVGLNDEIVLNR